MKNNRLILNNRYTDGKRVIVPIEERNGNRVLTACGRLMSWRQIKNEFTMIEHGKKSKHS